MEEIIKKFFCNYCINKREGCYKLHIKETNIIKTYKCENYKKEDAEPLTSHVKT